MTRDDSLLETIEEAIASRSDWAHIHIRQGQRIHIAVMSEPHLGNVFSNRKTIESRFSLNRITPYKNVEGGDIVFMKHGPIVGYFVVAWVKFFDLTEYPIERIAEEYSDAICVDAVFWSEKKHKKYATLMGIFDVHDLTPLTIQKHDRRAWLTL